MSMLHDVHAISKLSFRNQSSHQSVVLLDRLDDSFDATVCVAVSDWTFFVHDFGWDVRASVLVRSVISLSDDLDNTLWASALSALTETRAFAKCHVCKQCCRQSVITN